jgi:hypothetical protein
MQNISGFPYFEVQFNKEGSIHETNEAQEAATFIGAQGITDLFVISHGWNNDMADARSLYREFFRVLREALDRGGIAGLDQRKYAVLAVLWPSKKFADKELIPSGAASVGSPVTVSYLQQELEDLKLIFDAPSQKTAIDEAKKLVPNVDNSPEARRRFAELLRSLLAHQTQDREDAENQFFKLKGEEIMDRLSKPVPIAVPKPAGGAGGAARVGAGTTTPAGGAAGFFSGIKSGARNIINMVTYYEMKERAGTVGRNGVNQILRTLRQQAPNLKIHLIGHSFGGRLVTAAADGPESVDPVKPNSMTLLQAAFSHHGFAERYDNTNDGFFRKIVTQKKITGPIVITHTENDRAVGQAYPIASLLAGQQAAALGDKNSLYGGIGRNGAQKTPEGIELPLRPVGGRYEFEAGKLYSLNSDAFIFGHSDISKGEVAQAVLYAVAAT